MRKLRDVACTAVLLYNVIMKFSRQSHCVYHARYHLVFSTRFRRKVLKAGMGDYLCTVMKAIERCYPEIQIFELNTDNDHIHILCSIAPKMAVSTAVRILKCNTARYMVKKFKFLEKVYYDNDSGIWSTGYFMSTVGANEKVIKKYIEMQGREDSGQAQLELG
jgi:putative transposase